MTISDAKKRFDALHDDNWINVENETYAQDTLDLIPKQFISLTNKNRLNQILIKDDGIQSSYILEFFNSNKKFSFNKNRKEFNKICETVEKILGFKFGIIPERLGNFIFQFPITLLHVKEFIDSENDKIELSITWNKKLNEKPNGFITVTAKNDNVILGNSTKSLKNYNKYEFFLPNYSEEGVETTIHDLDNDLILYHDTRDYMYKFELGTKIICPEQRKFLVEGKQTEVDLYKKGKPLIKRKPIDFNDYISESMRYHEKIKLSEKLSFKKYNGEYEFPLEDLQKLISENDGNGVCLWDPFLTAEDIFNTLYYSSTVNVPLKAITSSEVGKFEDVKNQYKINENNDKHLKLEVRMQHKCYGYKFHDRFLIFPSDTIYEESKVYSLGTSINSFGNKHHILQLVSFPDLIIDAFNELWDKLDNENCILWKTF